MLSPFQWTSALRLLQHCSRHCWVLLEEQGQYLCLETHSYYSDVSSDDAMHCFLWSCVVCMCLVITENWQGGDRISWCSFLSLPPFCLWNSASHFLESLLSVCLSDPLFPKLTHIWQFLSIHGIAHMPWEAWIFMWFRYPNPVVQSWKTSISKNLVFFFLPHIPCAPHFTEFLKETWKFKNEIFRLWLCGREHGYVIMALGHPWRYSEKEKREENEKE